MRAFDINSEQLCSIFKEELMKEESFTIYQHRDFSKSIFKNPGQFTERFDSLASRLNEHIKVQFPFSIHHLQICKETGRNTAVVNKFEFADQYEFIEWVITSMVGCVGTQHAGQLASQYGRHVPLQGYWLHFLKRLCAKNFREYLINPSEEYDIVALGDFATPFILKCQVNFQTGSVVQKGASTMFNLFSMEVRFLVDNKRVNETWYALSDYRVKTDNFYIEFLKREIIRFYKAKKIRFIFDQCSGETKNNKYALYSRSSNW